ncbi:MAG: hypothetical protein OEX13_11505 [Gammaproteobacteria bacterium]|nr:hypothetical protein [Gammaproteobacteria bacterium]
MSLDKLQRTRSGKALSAVALLAWLTAAMQPCLMAMELVDAVEPVAEGQAVGHTMHVVAESEPCDSTLLSGCDLFPDVQVDTRAKAQQAGDDIQPPPVLVLDDPLFDTAHADTGLPQPACDPALLAAGPSLTIRYCSFLK